MKSTQDQLLSGCAIPRPDLITHTEQEESLISNQGNLETGGFAVCSSDDEHLDLKNTENWSGLLPFCCNECSKGFTNKSQLANHIGVHRPKKHFQCTEYEKNFAQKSQLLRHQHLHMGDRPFQCPECDKSFGVKEDMKAHQYRHREEKPFSCSDCGKGFTMHHYLTDNIRIHIGKKSFQCPECGKSFLMKADMRVHQ
ncbi:oocyte zinc finger protein XlCOF15-like [Vombatus ursinus]|uniref:oocyte zinc finger protein XlCOF15-like n=1 Tax=Vombatus ursinus TaxID=29139 RepID=UPI000FFD0668|nr:oocyte zinc finger protein XlCOF15-like [Vombatus ursinus]